MNIQKNPRVGGVRVDVNEEVKFLRFKIKIGGGGGGRVRVDLNKELKFL